MRRFILATLFLCAAIGDVTLTRAQFVTSGEAIGIVVAPLRASNLIISCGSGQVSINLDTGKVTLTDCTADDGAKAFWDAIERMYPRRKD